MLRVGDFVRVEEDQVNEFKMHTRMAIEEVPRRCQAVDGVKVVRTLQPSSKTISAFLNTEGGRIFFGIADNGVVEGLRLTEAQIDHFYLSLHDTLGRFNPPVSTDLVKVKVLKVLPALYETGSVDPWASDESDLDEKHAEKPPTRWANIGQVAEHILRAPTCECIKTTFGFFETVIIVVQILKSPDGSLYENEEGLAYKRRFGSNKCYTVENVRMAAASMKAPFKAN